MADYNAERKALGGASLMIAMVWKAIRAQGAATDPKRLAELEQLLFDGKAKLAVYIERQGKTLYLSAAALRPEDPDPFVHPTLRIRGPVIESPEELAALTVQGLH